MTTENQNVALDYSSASSSVGAVVLKAYNMLGKHGINWDSIGSISLCGGGR